MKSALLVFLSFASLATNASAYEAKMEIDPRFAASLPSLRDSKRIEVTTGKANGAYYSDASAVLTGVDLGRLTAASVDFKRYDDMKMPGVVRSEEVARAGDTVYTWTQMSSYGQTTKHYLEIKLLPEGTMWELTHKQTSWAYPEATQFRRLDGSWFMKKLPDGSIYVRYFITGVVDTGFPEFVVAGIMKKQFADGARNVIRILSNQAAIAR